MPQKEVKLSKQSKIEFEDMDEALKEIQNKKRKSSGNHAKKKKKEIKNEEKFLFEIKEEKNKQEKTPQKSQKNVKTKTQVVKKDNKKVKKKEKGKPIETKKTSRLEEAKQQKKRRAYKVLKYSALSIIILAALICFMYSPVFYIQTIEVTGNEKISKEEIISLSQIQKGQNTYNMSTHKVEEKIKQNAYVDTVKVNRNLPSGITIHVKERVATFQLEYGGGYVYLNNQGYMLEISTQKIEVPIIQGTHTLEENIKVGNRLDIVDLEKMTAVLKIVETATNNAIESFITRIDISNSSNYTLVMDAEVKTVYLGDSSNLTTKMLYLKALLEDNKNQPGEIFVNMDLNTNNPFFRKQV